MKFRMVDSMAGLTLGLLMVAGAHAGWGSSGGYYGGSSGYGSSGGYSASYASYGSSGGYASYGSSGGYTASYGSSGYASYGSSGGGILHRMATHIHDHMAAKRARHAARRASYGSSGYASYGSSGGYVASYGSSGGYASYGSSGGYSTYRYSGGSSGGSVSYGSTGTTSYGSVGATYYGASKTSATPLPLALASSAISQNDTVHLTVSVPSAATVYVNGNLTTSQGAVRQFVSRGLESGKDYRFQIRAELKAADGEVLTDEQEVVVQAGQYESLQFAFADSDSPIETAVTLNVPEDAVVRLAGSETKVVGESRVYRTQRLLPGEVWDDYEIEVTRGDQVKTQKIRLIAGDKLQLTFNFDETPDRLASR